MNFFPSNFLPCSLICPDYPPMVSYVAPTIHPQYNGHKIDLNFSPFEPVNIEKYPLYRKSVLDTFGNLGSALKDSRDPPSRDLPSRDSPSRDRPSRDWLSRNSRNFLSKIQYHNGNTIPVNFSKLRANKQHFSYFRGLAKDWNICDLNCIPSSNHPDQKFAQLPIQLHVDSYYNCLTVREGRNRKIDSDERPTVGGCDVILVE
jgi:hypothetical protein